MKNNKIHYFLTTLFLILTVGSPLIGSKEIFQIIPFIIYLIIYYYVNNRVKFPYRKPLMIFSFLTFFILISFLLNLDDFTLSSINFVFGFIAKGITALLLLAVIDAKKFIIYYINIVFYLASISIVFYIIFLFFPFLVDTLPHYRIDGDTNSYLVYIYHQPLYGLSSRNSSIFNEPGVFQGILAIAIIFIAYIIKSKLRIYAQIKHIYIKIIVLSIAIITAFSTAGLIILPFLLILCFNRKKSIIIITIFILLGAYIFPLTNYYDKFVFQKLADNNNSSTNRRFNDMKLELEISKSNMLFGKGYSFFKEKDYQLLSVGSIEKWAGSTNSITYHLALYGIFFVFLVLSQYYHLARILFPNIFFSLLFFVIFILILSSQTFLQKTLFVYLIYFSYSLSFKYNYGNRSGIVISKKYVT